MGAQQVTRRAFISGAAASALAFAMPALGGPVVDNDVPSSGTGNTPPASPPWRSSAWDGVGGFAAHASAVDLGRCRGMQWLAPEMFTPSGYVVENVHELFDAGWLVAARRLGYDVRPWIVLGADPEADAATLRALCAACRASAAVCDAEFAYQADLGRAERSGTFTAAMRGSGISLALSGLGAAYGDSRLPFDYDPWIKADAVFMPQCYPNEYGAVYEVPHCIEQALRAGWPLDRIKPTLGCYSSRYSYDPRVYAAQLEAAGVRGHSIYKAETASDADLRLLVR